MDEFRWYFRYFCIWCSNSRNCRCRRRAQAEVQFTAPASNGGTAITSYTATSYPDNFTGILTQAGSGTITITGLTNGTVYTFKVTATNAIGTSTSSAASNSVIPGAAATVPWRAYNRHCHGRRYSGNSNIYGSDK